MKTARFLLAVAGASLISLASSQRAVGVNLFWSGNGTTEGGAGTWDTTNPRWSTSPSGPFTTVWNNANVDSATLESTPGAITTGAPITVNLITVNTSTASSTTSWLIGNSTTSTANPITFSGANAGINATYTTGNIFLRNAAKGELVKTGPGRVELDNTMMAITKYTIQGGFLTIPALSRLGAAPGSLDQDFFVFDGGGFASTATTADLGTNRGITIMAGGAFFGASAATNVITVGAPIVGTSGGSLNVTNAGPFYSPVATGATLLLSNTSNSYDGATNVAAGTLRLGASGVIPDGSTVNVTGGIFDLNSNSETVGTVVINSSASRIMSTAGTPTLTGSSYDLRASNTAGGQGISVNLGGSASATKSTAGTVLLTAINSYTGSTTISAGTLSIDADATLGNGSGTVNLSGGTLNATADRSVTTNPVPNPINLTADSSITTTSTAANADLNLTSNSIGGSAGTLTFRNNGADAATDVFQPRFSGSGFDFARPIVIDNGATGKTELNSFNTTGTTQTFSGDISGNGSYARNESTPGTGGVTVFNGNNTYTGATLVNGGTLLVNGSLASTSSTTVNSGGTLGGTGSIAGPLTFNGGTLAPGASAGTLTLSGGGTVVFDSAAVLNYELNGADTTEGGLINDLLTGVGHLTLDGTLNIFETVANSFSTAMAGDTWRLINYSSAPNMLVNNMLEIGMTPASLPSGLSFVIDTSTLGQINLVAVPEASAFLAVGLVGLVSGAVVWRRKKRSAGKVA